MTLPADAATPGVARQRVRAWLEAERWPPDAVDDVELAVSEAISNAAEHAYPPGAPGPIILEAAVETAHDTTHARLVVRDHGRWRPEPPNPRYRGRGMLIIAAVMHEVVIKRGTEHGDGTVVVMVSPPVRTGP